MAREQPALEFLYLEIDRLSASLDKDALRPKLDAARTLAASDLKELKVPVLFITGMEDVIFPPPAAAALANLAPGAKLESVPEAGHSVYFQRPEIFNRLVSDFFEMHQGRTSIQRGTHDRFEENVCCLPVICLFGLCRQHHRPRSRRFLRLLSWLPQAHTA